MERCRFGLWGTRSPFPNHLAVGRAGLEGPHAGGSSHEAPLPSWIMVSLQLIWGVGAAILHQEPWSEGPGARPLHTAYSEQMKLDRAQRRKRNVAAAAAAAAAAKLLQSCPTARPHRRQPTRLLRPGILQAKTLEWAAISFSNAWKWDVKVKSLSRVRLLPTPWTAAHQAPPSMGSSRQEYWSGVPSASPSERLDLTVLPRFCFHFLGPVRGVGWRHVAPLPFVLFLILEGHWGQRTGICDHFLLGVGIILTPGRGAKCPPATLHVFGCP